MREDIERLRPKGSWALGTSDAAQKAALELESMVTPDEPVEAICWVKWGRKTVFDILALTDRRLILVGKGIIRREVEDFLLSRVSVISAYKRFGSTEITFTVGSMDRSVKSFDPPGANALVARARQLIAHPTGFPHPAAPAPADPVAQLTQLGKLRDAGVLTEAEFAAKKAELLGRI